MNDLFFKEYAVISLNTSDIEKLRESVFKTNHIIWTIVFVCLAIIVICYIRHLMRKVFYKNLRVKEVKAEVLYISSKKIIAKKDESFPDISYEDRAIITFRVMNRKKKKVYLIGEGLKQGDYGVLRYQGCYGLEFIKEGSYIEDKRNIYYHFGFNKNK